MECSRDFWDGDPEMSRGVCRDGLYIVGAIKVKILEVLPHVIMTAQQNREILGSWPEGQQEAKNKTQ